MKNRGRFIAVLAANFVAILLAFGLSACEMTQSPIAHTHAYTDTVVAPTCEDRGFTLHTCACGDSYADNYVDTVEHTVVTDEAVAPTCTTTGLTAGEHCSVCETVMTEQTVVPAFGHTFGEYTSDGNATCLSGGTKTAHCTRTGCSGTDTVENEEGRGEHVVNELGYCSECDEPIGTTKGVKYAVSANGQYAEVVGFEGKAEIVVILDVYEGLPVKTIGTAAFLNASSIVSVTIPNTVTSIGFRVFSGCTKLTSINVAEDNTAYLSLDGDVYTKDRTKIVQYAVGKTSTSCNLLSDLTEIGDYAFFGCTHLTKITIPDTITTIGYRAFQNCTHLTSVTIGKGVTTIESEAFYDCNEATFYCKSTSAPKGWGTSWNSERPVYWYSQAEPSLNAEKTGYTGNYWYDSVSGDPTVWVYVKTDVSFAATDGGLTVTALFTTATEIEIPAEYRGVPVLSIANNAFQNCTNLTSVTIADSVTTIGENAFYGCTRLTSVTLGSGATTIGKNAFYGCGSLTSITIPDDVTTIGIGAFQNCSKLTSIVIPDGVTTIGGYTFYGCANLTSITLPESVTTIGIYAFYNCTNLTSITIPDGVTSIGIYAFYNCTNLTSITIPDDVTTIGSSAFYNCTDLTSVRLGKGVTTIGNHAFYACSSLTTIMIPDSVTTIERSAFEECSDLTSVTFGKGVTTIDICAFQNCSKLTSVVIPDGVTTIGGSAFRNCTSLISVTLGKGVTEIGDYVLGGCNKLTSVTIWKGVTKISVFAFENCDSLTSVYYIGTIDDWAQITFSDNPLSYGAKLHIGNEVVTKVNLTTATKIGYRAFYGYDSLTSVTIGNSVTEIGDYAFSGCSGLTNVTIGTGVTEIGRDAFENCSGLTSITIPDSVTSIRGRAFYDCRKLKSIVIPDGVSFIGDGAFYGCASLIAVYYKGTKSEWDKITIGRNDNLINATRYYYSEAEPDLNDEGTAYNGNYWRYDNGKVKIWACAFSTEVSTEGLCYTVSNGVATVVGYEGTDTDVIIASVYQSVLVRKIGTGAFLGCNIRSVLIPDSVTSIGSSAFMGCAGLTSITIPNGVSEIRGGAFSGCINLKSIAIPDSVTNIGLDAFYGCSGLTSVTIPNSVTEIVGRAFYYCSSLTSVTIGNGVKTIEDCAFYYCDSLTEISIPANVSFMEGNPLGLCDKLANIDVASTNTAYKSIDGNLYTKDGKTLVQYAIGKTATSFAVPDGVTKIGYEAFYNCNNLTSVTIGSGVTTIGDCAFASCYKLVEVINKSSLNIEQDYSDYGDVGYYALSIHKGASKIVNQDGYLFITGDDEKNYLFGYTGTETKLSLPSDYNRKAYQISAYAFYGCDSLREVVIPESVTAVGENAFWNCDINLKIYCGADSLPSGWHSEWNRTEYSGVRCSVMWGIDERGFTDGGLGWYCSQGKIGIDGYTGTATVLEIPDTIDEKPVTMIGPRAFNNCDKLTSVSIPDSVTEIGEWAFNDCNKLTSVSIGGNVDSIGERAFAHCNKLTSITIPDSVTSIGKRAFNNCDGLTSITIPNNVTEIGYEAFYNCNNLTSVTIGRGVTTIGDCAFSSCYKLAEVINKSSLNIKKGSWDNGYVGAYAHAVHSGASKIVDQDGYWFITDNGTNYLVNCVERKEARLSLPSDYNGQTYQISAWAFYTSCTYSLREVVVSDDITAIGESAFHDCFTLTTVYYKGTESEWNNISIGSSNDYLTNATRYYYSEAEPTTSGNYWHYNAEGGIEIWAYTGE